MGHPIIIVPMFLLLAVALWWSLGLWNSVDTALPTEGWVALILGVVLSLIIGCGLFFLAFQSNKRGFDDGATGAPEMQESDEDTNEDSGRDSSKDEVSR